MEGTQKEDENKPYCTLLTVQRQVFSLLLTCLPFRHQRWTPLAPPERHSSLIDLTGTASNYLSGIKGLACPYGSPKCQEEKLNSRQECGKLLQWQGFPKARRSAPAGTFTICRQLKPYHSVNSGSNPKTLCGIAVWAT